MVSQLKDMLKEEENKKYSKLLEFIEGKSGDNFNIEYLVSTLDELIDLVEGRHSLRPFLESWLVFLSSISVDFKILKDFRKFILRVLKEKWIIPGDYIKATSYLPSLNKFMHEEHKNNLHLFTLNYDLCIENACSKYQGNDILIERGFGIDEATNINWDWNYFKNEEPQTELKIFLYKLHGSIDWTRDKNDQLIRQEVQSINPQNVEIIFGERQKLKSADPYLFLIYELRQCTLNSQIIIVSGYSFADTHINDILKQSVLMSSEKRLLINVYSKEESETIDDLKVKYTRLLSLPDEKKNQVEIFVGPTSDFLNSALTMEELGKLFPHFDTPLEEL